MGEDQVNLLCNSFFPDPCQSCTPCNSRAVRLQALVSATRKMPEAINPFSDELAKSTHAGAERSRHTETGGTWRVAVGCALSTSKKAAAVLSPVIARPRRGCLSWFNAYIPRGGQRRRPQAGCSGHARRAWRTARGVTRSRWIYSIITARAHAVPKTSVTLTGTVRHHGVLRKRYSSAVGDKLMQLC